LLGRDRELVEALLQERSAGLRRTRVAMRYRALDADAPSLDDPLKVPEEVAPTGRCTDCGGVILAGRLRAIPGAVRCASCQLEHESHTV
jgi:Prokaryotic dksA/traR C4-type zinc finger